MLRALAHERADSYTYEANIVSNKDMCHIVARIQQKGAANRGMSLAVKVANAVAPVDTACREQEHKVSAHQTWAGKVAPTDRSHVSRSELEHSELSYDC